MSKIWNSRDSHAVPHDAGQQIKCLIGGAIACGITHTFVTPLDVVKCNMQANPGKFKNVFNGFSGIMAEEGAIALLKGWQPTMIGQHAQGMIKFGFNEFFKDEQANWIGEEAAVKYRGLLWAAASASAEFFADIALCPMEMIKVRVQTSDAGTFPTEFGAALTEMRTKSAEFNFPFGSLVPLWTRQIPQTVVKFVGFESFVEAFYKQYFTKPKSEQSKSTQLGITFASGQLAGIFCAIVSQPADNLVSQMGRPDNKGKSFGQMINEQGWKRLFMNGLGTRIFMIGTLTALQWYIYDSWKTAMGLGTSGGGSVKK